MQTARRRDEGEHRQVHRQVPRARGEVERLEHDKPRKSDYTDLDNLGLFTRAGGFEAVKKEAKKRKLI